MRCEEKRAHKVLLTFNIGGSVMLLDLYENNFPRQTYINTMKDRRMLNGADFHEM